MRSRTPVSSTRPSTEWHLPSVFALGLVAAVALASARPAEAIIIACNETHVYAAAPSCTAMSNPCIINDIVICGGTCGDICIYDFGTKAVQLSGNLGSFINATDNPKRVWVYAGSITASSEAVVRFDAGGGGMSVYLETSTGGVSIPGGTLQSTGDVAGVVQIESAGTVLVGRVDVRATDPGEAGGVALLRTNSVPGDVTVSAAGVDASAPGGGGGILLIGTRVTTLGPLLAKSTGSGSGGFIALYTNDGASPPGPSISVQGLLDASVTAGTSTGNGGTVDMGIYSYPSTIPPIITILEEVNVGSTLGNAGAITLNANYVTTGSAGSNGLFATAGSNTGTHGGTITVTTNSTTVTSDFHKLEARGHTGGTIKIRSKGNLLFDTDVRVDANQGPDGKGGNISIRTKDNNGVNNCWDCQEPFDTCRCGVPPSCTQKFQIDEDLVVNGSGTQGDGGVITLEAPFVYMRASGTARRLMANATSGTDSTSGDQPGRIRVRARDSQFRARTDPGTNHKIRALPDRGPITETCITQPLGGNYNPDWDPCGPTYAPQCNPG